MMLEIQLITIRFYLRMDIIGLVIFPSQAIVDISVLPNFLKAENRKYTYVTNKLQIFLKYVDFYKAKLYNDFGI